MKLFSTRYKSLSDCSPHGGSRGAAPPQIMHTPEPSTGGGNLSRSRARSHIVTGRCRWVQAECRRLGEADAPEVDPVLQRAAAALRERPVLFKYCAEEVAQARHNALFQRCGPLALLAAPVLPCCTSPSPQDPACASGALALHHVHQRQVCAFRVRDHERGALGSQVHWRTHAGRPGRHAATDRDARARPATLRLRHARMGAPGMRLAPSPSLRPRNLANSDDEKGNVGAKVFDALADNKNLRRVDGARSVDMCRHWRRSASCCCRCSGPMRGHPQMPLPRWIRRAAAPAACPRRAAWRAVTRPRPPRCWTRSSSPSAAR